MKIEGARLGVHTVSIRNPRPSVQREAETQCFILLSPFFFLVDFCWVAVCYFKGITRFSAATLAQGGGGRD